MPVRRRGRSDSLSASDYLVAGNGLMDRRAFFTRSFALAGAASAASAQPAACAGSESQAGPRPDRGLNIKPYGRRSRFERRVLRTLSHLQGESRTLHARAPQHLLNGTITPRGLHFAVVHEPLPDIDPAQHKLVIHGMVRRSLVFTLEKLARYPMVARTAFIECDGNSAPMLADTPVQADLQHLHGLASNSEWTGVLVSTLLDDVGVDPKAEWLIAEGADAAPISRSTPLNKAWDDAMIALYQNGERIMPDQGYPLRLVLPGWKGEMQTKYIRRLMVCDRPAMTYYEERSYSQLSRGEVGAGFQFVNEVKSFITHPSFGMELDAPGLYEISGLAYSGRGRIERVLVSADGGKSWAESALQGPVSSKSFTRFHIPWNWDGSPAVLTSRAVDEAGEAQPLRADFLAAPRKPWKLAGGVGCSQQGHYNALTSWAVAPSGEIRHVYI